MKSIIYLHLLELIPKIVSLIFYYKHKEIIAEPVQNGGKPLGPLHLRKP